MENVQALAKEPRMEHHEREDLVLAKSLLEHPGVAAQVSKVIGAPLQRGFDMLPASWTNVVHRSVRLALWSALNVAISSLQRSDPQRRSRISYKMLLGATGGLGGVFGLAALPVELPISTTLMLRGIAEVARSEGFTLDDWETRLACLEVFAFAGPVAKNAPAESSYWVTRSALATAVKDAAAYIARRAMVTGSAPVLARLVEMIAPRFGAVVSQHVAAKAVPLLGAVAGSTINVIFMDHFQKVALGHFIVKRLEKKYGVTTIRAAYEQLPDTTDVRVAV